MMNFIFNENDQLIPDTFSYIRCDPQAVAFNLSQEDLFRIMAACNCDTSRLSETLREAIAIKTSAVVQHKKELAELRKQQYMTRSAAFHNSIMEEMRALSGGKPFTVTSLQICAANSGNAFITRSWQMYSRHLLRALNCGEPVKRENKQGQVVKYVTKRNVERTRHIGYNAPSIWSFTD